MTTLAKSQGIVTALITPFTSTNEVHLESLARIVEHAIRLGAGGLYVCGTTGEGFLLSEQERELIVEQVVGTSAGRADVIVNISHMDIRQSFHLADHAAANGATAVSALPPLFYGVGNQERIAYFRALLSRISLPLTIYNIPHLSHQQLDLAVVSALADEPRFAGIKHTSNDGIALMQFKLAASGRLIVWCGRDACLLGHLAMGADGAIGSSYQLLGDISAAILAAYRSSNLERALKLQQRVNEVHERLQMHGPIPCIKRCLALLGVESGGCRLPLPPVRTDIDDFLRETLVMGDQIRSHFELPHVRNVA